jgi:beta-glucosidase
MQVRRLLFKIIKIVAAAVAVLVVAVVTWSWWSYPKRSIDSFLTRRASFSFAKVPQGRALSPEEADTYARRMLETMSLREKVLQMSGDTWVWDFFNRRIVGRAWRAGADRRLGLPPIVCSDGPRGIGMGFSTCFPVAMARAASWDVDLEQRIGEAAATELRAQGGNMWLAPCINILRHPSWGRAQETYGEDPFLVGEMGAALVTGAQRHNVMACAKHYTANSIELTRMTVDVRMEERTLREVYLPQFKRVVDAGAASIMTAYNKVNGDYCSENTHLVREILKGEWGFRGFVVSDWFTGVHDGVKAARAGLDLEMPSVNVYGEKLEKAVERGEVSPAIVDEAVERILRTRIDYATRPDAQSYDRSLVRAPEHVTLAREAAEKGIVLLKNTDHLLPLDDATLRSLAVLGRLADSPNLGDRGSSIVYPRETVTVLDGLRTYLGPAVDVIHEPGSDPDRARQAARRTDAAVVVVGFDHSDEGEYIPVPLRDASEWGGDRESLALKPGDRALVEAVAAENPRTIVILIGGAAVMVEGWGEKVGAILMGFYPGEQGGTALARILFGEVNPSGKLPFTVPRSPEQLPPFDNHSERVEYGYYHGYTLIDRAETDPAYPFGFGLAYTTYAYGDLALDASEIAPDGTVHASVTVTNTGSRAGDEVVELYVGFPGASVDRPVKLLRGFRKVHLDPGASQRVVLPIKATDLAFYDTGRHTWVTERQDYRVLVGPSSRPGDLLSATFRVSD